MEATVQVRQRGTIVLPAELRKKYDIQAGTLPRIVDLDGVFVLTRIPDTVSALAHEIERARLDMGLTTSELLASLREQRLRYYQEHYGQQP